MPSERYELPVFHEIYTPAVLGGIAERAKSDKGLKVLERFLAGHNEHLRIERVHFDKCLRFAKRQEGIDADRKSRLREPENYAAWRSVYNELLVAYFFANVFKLKVKFITNAKEHGLGDFQIIDPEEIIIVEIKTPKGDDLGLQATEGDVHCGLDEYLLRPALREGGKQLKRGKKNLIVICTQLCEWIVDDWSFEKLFYGQEKIIRALDQNSHEPVGPAQVKFVPDGEFHKNHPENKENKKWYTRISAIASFRNDRCLGLPFSEREQQVQFTLLHNYHALRPISPDLFPDVEQFIPNRKKGSIEHINEGKSAFLIEG